MVYTKTPTAAKATTNSTSKAATNNPPAAAQSAQPPPTAAAPPAQPAQPPPTAAAPPANPSPANPSPTGARPSQGIDVSKVGTNRPSKQKAITDATNKAIAAYKRATTRPAKKQDTANNAPAPAPAPANNAPPSSNEITCTDSKGTPYVPVCDCQTNPLLDLQASMPPPFPYDGCSAAATLGMNDGYLQESTIEVVSTTSSSDDCDSSSYFSWLYTTPCRIMFLVVIVGVIMTLTTQCMKNANKKSSPASDSSASGEEVQEEEK